MWQDVVLYWAWCGGTPKDGLPPTPTKKRLEYAKVHYPNWHPELMTMSICCGVFDDDEYTEKNRAEIKWHEDRGAEITWPSAGT